tara:strand:+ start:4150 stop:4737 length:588 start_codon:yes stop_codon:yes gene_type:complete
MKSIDNLTFNDAEDGIVVTPPGAYPAHVTGVVMRTFDSGNTVYNLTFKVAKEVSKLNVPKLQLGSDGIATQVSDSNGNPMTLNGKFISGKEFRLEKGVWLNPNPGAEKWKNRNYVNTCELLGIEFNKDKDGNKQIGQAEESDLLGKPCTIEVKEVEWKNEETSQSGKSLKAVKMLKWEGGYTLSEDELSGEELPF